VDSLNPARRSLCIVSRDPLQCSELVLSLQALVPPDDEVEIIMDRRRGRSGFDTSPAGPAPGLVDRRRNPRVDLDVRTKGFAIVPAAPMTPRPLAEPDGDDRARFENVLSFKRRREARPRRVVGAAGAVIVALILSPPLSSFSDRVPDEAPSSAGATNSESSLPAARPGQSQSPGAERAPTVSGPPPSAAAPGNTPSARAKPPTARTTGPRAQKTKNGTRDTYAERVEEASGRIVSKAKGLIDRVKGEVVGHTPIDVAPEAPNDDAPAPVKPRPAQTP
jgi:hypothetical protein